MTADLERPPPHRPTRSRGPLTHRTAKIAAICAVLGGATAWWAVGATPHLASGAVAYPPTAAARPEPVRSADPATGETAPEQRSSADAASDPVLGALVRKRLQWDTAVDPSLLQVQVDDARVALSGTVGSARERQRAIDAAWIAGVRDVDATALLVAARRGGSAERLPGPATIERSIMGALAVDPSVAGADVQVTVRGAIATLRGRVDNLAAARAAELVAAHTYGVAAVGNEIAIAPWGDDEAIATDVLVALATDPETAAFGVEARSEDGAVTLEGEVDTFAQRTVVEDVAARIHGVQALDNRLRVRSGAVAFYYDPHPRRPAAEPGPTAEPGAVADDDIAAAIRAELQWSRFLGNVAVDVSVRRGTATLTGDVPTTAIHDVVLWNAYQGGAKAVVDRLFVAGDPLAGTAPQADPGDVVFGRD